MTSIKFTEVALHMDVLCVQHYRNYILAGIGNNLFVYKDQSLQLSKRIFHGERLHQILVKNNTILLKGGRELAIASLQETLNQVTCQIVSKITCSDWIQDVAIVDDDFIALNTAHNLFELWRFKTPEYVKVSTCDERCILYSCKIIGNTQDDIIIFSGTVFGDLLIWSPISKENFVLHRFKAHNGAVFSIEFDKTQRIITTTSDDRSLKIWSITSEKSLNSPYDWTDCNIQLIQTLFGHTARVWRSLILPDYYVTIGEDSKLIVWNHKGEVFKSLLIHQESGIRALEYSSECKTIITGGEDGGLNTISWNFLTSETDAVKILTFEHNFSTKICFSKNGIIYTCRGGCSRISGGAEEVIYQNEHFDTYCLMEVSEELIILGSIKGHLVVIDVDTNSVLVEGQFLQGRVYSIHWFKERFLTCGPGGCLDLWEVRGRSLKNLNQMILPTCKERWTTCGVLHNDNLIVGDRMGNLYMYDLEKEDPVMSFRKIHSYLGVTDIKTVPSGIRTIGRDGTVKTFSNDFVHLLTYKLPMDWPWKIVKHNNEELILGFHSVFFVVWSVKDHEIIASHDCGGGHRSCDFKITNDRLTFLYVKEKKVFEIDLNLNKIVRTRNGFHGKEINCLRMLQTNPKIIITGSEDTTLRISRIEKSELEPIAVLKSHTSSVRDVEVCFINPNKLLIVSVGGKGQIVIWTFDTDTQNCQEMVSYRLRKENRNWKSQEPEIDPETRVMCVDILETGNEFLIAIGCSDCQIRLFTYNQQLCSVASIYYSHCVLKIKILRLGERVLMSSMGTDGHVVFWDVTNHTTIQQLGAVPIHQSGINSFQFQELTSGKYLLATGGDDNMISVSVVEFLENKVTLKILWQNSSTHSCQITGIKILKNFMITTSIDQRVTVWRYTHDHELEMKHLNQYLTLVPDIQGMDAKWENESTILISVHGKGVEMLRANVCSFIEPR